MEAEAYNTEEHEEMKIIQEVESTGDKEKEKEKEEKEEDDDGGDGDLTTEEGFRSCTCGMCGKDITMYHRYYYKCTISSCDYSIHEFCSEVSTRLVHPSHPHLLTLFDDPGMLPYWNCSVCDDYQPFGKKGYKCSSCHFFLDIWCAVEAKKKIIYHPCHPHFLIPATCKPILCKCSACGKKHEGIFYQCPTCDFFTIHKFCAFLPNKLLIQQATHDAYYHTHPLTISYSFLFEDQIAKHFPTCRVCRRVFYYTEYLWIYKCDKCLYYAHVDCATSSEGSRKTIKNFEDVDHPHLLHLPFPDVSYSIPKHVLFEESRTLEIEEVNIKHNSHQHPLILVDQTSSKKISSWSLMCYDPMKKIQLLCNGCVRPITDMPFFKCDNEEDEDCNFALHEWCTRLPAKIENHPGHSQHTLVLMLNNLEKFFGVFHCAACCLPCNGFAYCCLECGYYVDVTCGLMPVEITHKAHPNHLLSVARSGGLFNNCGMCRRSLFKSFSEELAFGCKVCDTYIHSKCALLIPDKISHKYEKHPMHLSYLPIENHKSEYFCEICEEDLNPHRPFYHCQDCVQSIHTTCAPSILQSETETYSETSSDYPFNNLSIHGFINIKFGGIYNTDGHPHPLSFAQGTVLDGHCSGCGKRLRYKMIFKCIECKFAIDHDCCKSLKKI